ncbi:helix-turn-helix domain-containing protein [Bradyrhizobium canariense]|nr:helix-turn-helix domain-containing protein [Bradyrhizobium canariense]
MTQANYSTEPNTPAGIVREVLDVAAIRHKFRQGHHTMTQQAFADGLGIPVRTLRNWEQGKRKPTGPALVLLRMVERDPQVLEKIRA